MNLRNRVKVIPMCFSKGAIENFLYIHKRFKANPQYRLKYLIRCSLNVIKHERIIRHEGNFRACDFIYEGYGNVLREPIDEIWKKMHQVYGGPKCGCYAKKHCKSCSEDKVPKYYRLLGGEK